MDIHYLVKGTKTQISGIEYRAVYDRSFYEKQNPDYQLKGLSDEECLQHFLTVGMKDGRSGAGSFCLEAYQHNYPMLREKYGMDHPAYYHHFLQEGMKQGWSGVFDIYHGICYREVFEVGYYKTVNPDVADAFRDDLAAYIGHFVEYGMDEGRMAKQSFDVYAYKRRYDAHFCKGFGCLKDYFMDYLNTDREKRISGSCSVYGDTDYSPVYSYAYYKAQNDDIRMSLGENASAYIKHFVEYGMDEGRSGNGRFDVWKFKEAHPQLVEKLGDYLPLYYLEYIRMEEGHGY